MIDKLDYKIVFQVLSRILFIISVALLFCVVVALIFSEDYGTFLYSAAISLLMGLLCFWVTRTQGESIAIHKKEAYLTVTLSWFFMSLVGSLPYIFSGYFTGFTNAFFESVSGFTTTGSSILNDIEALPKSLLFWRSLTHWIGGIGIIVLVIVVMPTLRMGGYNMFTLESSLQEKIRPKIKTVGYRLLWIYLSLTLAEVILLMLGKMNLFESVCHAFGTIATGGFSPKNTSLIEYSPYIQYVVMIFMLLAGTNFVIHYYLVKREFKKVKGNEEVRFYISSIITLGIIITILLYFKMDKPLEKSFREAFFQVISIITSTGFATADYLQWPQAAWLLIFFAMFLGGSTGSTAGGVKMARQLVVLKNIRRTFRLQVSPNAVIPIKLNNTPINTNSNNSIMTFVSVYFLVFVISTFVLVIMGIDGKTASSSVATCMAGIGPGIGSIGPVSNFAHLPDMAKLFLSFIMLVGRLEIYTVVLLFTRFFWIR